MNLTGFKKVHDDDNKAILKNHKGHEITIAKKSLTEKHRKAVCDLPLHAADGADVPGSNQSDYTSLPDDRDPSTNPANMQSPPQEDTPPAPTQPVAQAPAQPVPAQASPEQNYNQGRSQYIQDVAMKRGQEDAAWEQDHYNGHITPETYHDLFAKKSTLGKIGSVFGLLLSGVGSGMTHQPNMALQMMDNEIKNDLQAQIQNKSNAMSYWRANQENRLNEANIGRVGAETQLAAAGAKKTGAETQLTKANVGRVGAETQLAGAQAGVQEREAQLADAKLGFWHDNMNQMRTTATHHLQQQVDKISPTSAQKAPAQQLLNNVKAAVQQENNQANLQVATAQADNPEGVFQQRQKMLRSGSAIGIPLEGVANAEASRHVPGFGDASVPVDPDVRKELIAKQEYETAARNYVDFAKKHQANWENLNLKDRNTIANQGGVLGAELQGKYRNKTHGGVFKEGEQNFIEGIIPNNAASWKASWNQIPKVEQTIVDNQADKEALARGYGLIAPRYNPKTGKYYTKGPDGKTVEAK